MLEVCKAVLHHYGNENNSNVCFKKKNIKPTNCCYMLVYKMVEKVV